jgi:hypothetical protein
VGSVEGSDAYIGVVVDGDNEALAYVCDSDQISQWFRGKVAGNKFEVASGDARLSFALTEDAARGTVNLGNGV